MIRTILLVVLLVGCGGSDSGASNNHGLGFEYDVQGASGIRVRFVDGSPPIGFYNDIYDRVQQCVNHSAPGPLIVFVDEVDSHVTDGHDPFAGIYLDNGTILIETKAIQNIEALKWAVAHESVHWVTHWNQLLTIQQQSEHASSLFLSCTTPTVIG